MEEHKHKNLCRDLNIFDFKIKVDESKQNAGLKKFKFGPGINSAFNKNMR